MKKKSLVIVGGGATGVCVAFSALEQCGDQFDIRIIEPSAELGLGKAYHTVDTENVLNVAAGNMSLSNKDPGHFLEWLRVNGFTESSFPFWPFVARKVYGRYLSESMNSHSSRYTHVRDQALQIRAKSSTYSITLASGGELEADYVVVATGYKKESNIFSKLIDKASCDRLLFVSEAEARVFSPSSKILIVGTGLTAIDVWKRLRKDPSLDLTIFSRHGLLPLAHQASERVKRFPVLPGMTPLQVLQVLRTMQAANLFSWPQLADEVRLQSTEIWTCWSAQEKKQFIRHVKPYWEVIRHRIPSKIAELLEADFAAGKLKRFSGKVRAIRQLDSKLEIQVKHRNLKEIEPQLYDYVILATGSSIDQDLFGKQKVSGVRLSKYGLGYINDSAPNIWFAGPSSKATFWEITAIPDIRTQAASIVGKIKARAKEEKSLQQYRFLEHPTSVNESYFQHLFASIRFSRFLMTKAWYNFVHSFLPFIYGDKTSNDMRNFAITLSKRRRRKL